MNNLNSPDMVTEHALSAGRDSDTNRNNRKTDLHTGAAGPGGWTSIGRNYAGLIEIFRSLIGVAPLIGLHSAPSEIDINNNIAV